MFLDIHVSPGRVFHGFSFNNPRPIFFVFTLPCTLPEVVTRWIGRTDTMRPAIKWRDSKWILSGSKHSLPRLSWKHYPNNTISVIHIHSPNRSGSGGVSSTENNNYCYLVMNSSSNTFLSGQVDLSKPFGIISGHRASY